MADRYLRFTHSTPGRFATRRLGLPQPAELRRWSAERPTLDGPLLHLTAGISAHRDALAAALSRTGLDVRDQAERPAAVVLDATGVRDTAGLGAVHAALHPVVRGVRDSGRIVVLGTVPDPADHHQAAAQQALEGFVRSLGKEAGRGRTVQLVRITDVPGAESTLRFLLSPKSAYVSGQVITTGSLGEQAAATGAADEDKPLAGRTALVTGGARGIGEAVAATLARDGAHVVVLDVPAAQSDLVAVAERLGGTALPLDITAEDAGERIAAALPDGLDILVHNAGITRDRRLQNMPADRWASVLDVNLASVLTTTDALLKAGTIRPGGRIVATASIAGLAGNSGQTNYAASKAGIVGLVRSLGPRALAEHGVTVNAGRPRLHRDQDDRGRPPLHPRGGPPHELPRAGRAPGGRRRDHRLVRAPRLGRRQRPGRPGLRPVAAGGLTMADTHLATPPALLPLLAKGGATSLFKRASAGAAPPATRLVLSRAEVDPKALRSYAELCGFAADGVPDEQSVLPVTYPHLLGFPLQLRLMTSAAFPFPLMGLVHTSITITQHRELRGDDGPELIVYVEEFRPHRRGTEAVVVTEARMAGRTVWSSALHLSGAPLRRQRPGGRRAPGRTCRPPRRGHLEAPRLPRPPLRRRRRRPQPRSTSRR